LDWGAENHVAIVADGEGRQRGKLLRLKNTQGSLDELLRAIGGDARGVRVAVEARRLVIVDALLRAGFEVFVINPRQVDRFRDRFSSSGAKDDRRDAEVLASALRSDPDCFTRVSSSTKASERLSAATRTLVEMEAEQRRQANQLREVVLRVLPLLLSLCPGADEAWFWELLKRVPSPTTAAKLRRGDVEKVLKKHRIRRHSTDDVVAVLRAAHLEPDAGVLVASKLQMRLFVERLQVLDEHIDQMKREEAQALEEMASDDAEGEHALVDVVRSAPGFGPRTTAVLLVEGGAAIRDNDLDLLRAISGVAPVTKQSGKMHVVGMRRAVNPHLRNALHHAAEAARRTPRFAPIYERLRARGSSHARALRGVADRLLTVVMAMIHARSLYELRPKEPSAA
jgi:transposase